jgi:hypothetical protein
MVMVLPVPVLFVLVFMWVLPVDALAVAVDNKRWVHIDVMAVLVLFHVFVLVLLGTAVVHVVRSLVLDLLVLVEFVLVVLHASEVIKIKTLF